MCDKNCGICGKPFQARAKNERYCCKECSTVARRQACLRFYHKKQAEERQKRLEHPPKKPRKVNQLAIRQRAEHLAEIKAECSAWLERYNATGEKGAAAMLAKEAGMTYAEWQALPLGLKVQKRGEILEKKKYPLRKDYNVN